MNLYVYHNLAIIWDRHRRQAAPRPTPLKWKCRGSDASPETAWVFFGGTTGLSVEKTRGTCVPNWGKLGNHVVKWEKHGKTII